jgi:hypothetical protein
MPVTKSKSRNAAPPATKICSKCNQTKLLSNFYSNRDWVEQLGKDIWCKECVGKCATKDELREYFWTNNREWNEKLWSSSKKKAELTANKNPTYQKAFEQTKKNILDRLTCQNVIKSMQINYKFVDHTNDIYVQTYQDAKEEGQITSESEEDDPNVKKYSDEFNGWFKPEELKYLEEYYRQLENDFELSDVNLRDTAKKLAKASLQADKVQDKYMAGQATLQDVKDAMTLFDLLSKSGNFSASKRKPGEKGGLGSWAEISFYCETNGHPMTRQIEWPKDDVDKTIDEFRYIVEALDLNGA